ncbi:MAG TPA: phosphoglycerate mutase (2,3-diphosphoglycerate-independent), partial [Gammaproteobacteria bacterium]|nr:phosphoglycerate mutase (2,3-diphosphoglycerate-independent) [Gammaproteobacteria bacterium]
MDRDQRWDRVQLAWKALTQGNGEHASNATQAIDQAYSAEQTDEFIKPTMIEGATLIESGDQMIFFNFRNDRPRELTQALALTPFDGFDRGDFTPIAVTTMTMYAESYKLPIAFEKEAPQTTLAQIISDHGLKQFHCSETEKYPHVTYFFNGGREEPYPGEDRQMIDSPKVATYDLQPEMSAIPVADTIIQAMESGEYAFIVVNFANGDMVGHTGNLEAAIQAMEVVDMQCGRLIECAQKTGYSLLLTADHGNCDQMLDPFTKEPHTQHTTFPVGCSIIDETPWKP